MRVRVYQEFRSDDAEDSYQAPLDAIDAYLASRPRVSWEVTRGVGAGGSLGGR